MKRENALQSLKKNSREWKIHACHFLTFAALALLSGGCNYNDLKSAPPAAGKGDPGAFASVDFQTVKTKVIDVACLRCHSGPTPKAGVRLETYAEVFNQAAKVKFQVETGAMPPRPPGLSTELKALLFAWVDSGAPETTVVSPTPIAGPTPLPPGEIPDFATVSREVFIPHCLKCHDNSTQKGKVNLEVYTLAKSVISEIAFSLDTDDMPRKAPALPPALKSIVYSWINAGAPEFVP